jgi:FtsP/CotA-like multicopper oxidase with cupredoxin domain
LYPKEAGTYDLVYKNPAFTETIWSVVVAENTSISQAWSLFSTLRTVDQVIADIDTYREYFDKPVDKKLRLDMTLNGKTKDDMSLKMEHAHDGTSAKMWWLTYDLWELEWLDEMFEMNNTSTDEWTKRQLIDEDTNKTSMMIDDWKFNQWDIIKVRITNDGEWLHPMQHPIHFHGQRFLVINKNWVPNDNMVWMDTVLTLPGEYVDILIDMSNPWKRMAHCHIAEHMHAGMMMNFEVVTKE